MPRPITRVLPWIVGIVVVLGLLVGRVVWGSRQELAAGRAEYARGDRDGAVIHLGRAAHWYAPGNPFVTDALEELRRIGRQAEMGDQTDLALSAYRAIRSSCLGTRSFYTPHADRLAEANRRIATLMANQPPPPVDRDKTVSQRRDEHLALLERVEQPDPLWSVLACVSFLAWIGGAFGFFLRGLDRDLKLLRRPAMLWGGLVVAGLAVWIVSLLLA
jgi:hypothetical protein